MMHKITLVLSLTTLAVAGCGAATPTVTSAPPTAASGYATITSDFADPTETISRTAQVQNVDWNGTGNISQKNVTVTISATGNTVNGYDEYVATYAGIPVTIAWDISDGLFKGTNGNIEIRISPWWTTPNGQLVLSWINLWDSSGTEGDSWGFTTSGFNSDPAAVAGRSGTATFDGWGGISMAAQDDSFWTSADGAATLTALFDTNTISGSIDLVDCGCGFGSVTISNTTLTLNPMAIEENTFAGSATIVPADFSLSGVGIISVDGMFYEANATAVGGQLSGAGTATGTGTTTYLNGAFAANE